MKVYDPETKKYIEMTKTTYYNMWNDTIKTINEKENKRRIINEKSFLHDTTIIAKDAKKFFINKTKSFVISGFGKKKFDLMTWLWQIQIKIEKKFIIISRIFSMIRQVKLFIKRVLYGINSRRV
ncbi:MAG: hypothetical protein ACUVQP_04920 [Bacteroidales bacterium]